MDWKRTLLQLAVGHFNDAPGTSHGNRGGFLQLGVPFKGVDKGYIGVYRV